MIGCLVLAGLGVGLTIGRSPSSSGSGGLASGSSAESVAAAATNATAPVPTESSSSASAASSSSAASVTAPFAGNAPFTVTASGTKYEAATLAAQVREKLHVSRPTGAGADEGSIPAAALRGCVVHLTGGLPPQLVDRATYQGNPAYIIASSSRVWVVGLGCTAADSELIRSVSLAG